MAKRKLPLMAELLIFWKMTGEKLNYQSHRKLLARHRKHHPNPSGLVLRFHLTQRYGGTRFLDATVNLFAKKHWMLRKLDTDIPMLTKAVHPSFNSESVTGPKKSWYTN